MPVSGIPGTVIPVRGFPFFLRVFYTCFRLTDIPFYDTMLQSTQNGGVLHKQILNGVVKHG